MLPSQRQKFRCTPRKGAEEDLERAARAASRQEIFIATSKGGAGLSQSNNRASNRTLQNILVALARKVGITVDDPRPKTMKRARGGPDYQGHLFSTSQEDAGRLLGTAKMVEHELVHDAYFFNGKEETVAVDQRVIVQLVRFDDIHLVSLPGAPAGAFEAPDERVVHVGARASLAPATMWHFAESPSVRGMLCEAMAWALGGAMLGQVADTQQGEPGWVIEVPNARVAEEITGAPGAEVKMRHGAIFDVRLRFTGELERMGQAYVGLPLRLDLPATIAVDETSFEVSVPDPEEAPNAWQGAEVLWTGASVRNTRLLQLERVAPRLGTVAEPSRYVVLGGEENAALLAQAINASPGGVRAAPLDRWERRRVVGRERRKGAAERRSAAEEQPPSLPGLVEARLAQIVQVAHPGANAVVCPVAVRSFTAFAARVHGVQREMWIDDVLTRAMESAQNEFSVWAPGDEWMQHICAAGRGCKRTAEPCFTVAPAADAMWQAQRAGLEAAVEARAQEARRSPVPLGLQPALAAAAASPATTAAEMEPTASARPEPEPDYPRCACPRGCFHIVVPSDRSALCDFCFEGGGECDCAGEANGPNGEACCAAAEAAVSPVGMPMSAPAIATPPQGPAPPAPASACEGAAQAAEAALPTPGGGEAPATMATEVLTPPASPSQASPQPAMPSLTSPKRAAESAGGGRAPARPKTSPSQTGRGYAVRGRPRGQGRGLPSAQPHRGTGGCIAPRRMAGPAAAALPGLDAQRGARPGAGGWLGGHVPAHRRAARRAAAPRGAKRGGPAAGGRNPARHRECAGGLRQVGRRSRRRADGPEVDRVGALLRGHGEPRGRAQHLGWRQGGVDSRAPASSRVQPRGHHLHGPQVPHPAQGHDHRIRRAGARGHWRQRVRGGEARALRLRATPTVRVNLQGLARRKFLKRYEDGVEPNPGPPESRGHGGERDHTREAHTGGTGGRGGRRATVRTAAVRHLVGCTFGHRSERTVPVGAGNGQNRRAYVCGKCRQHFVQNDPAQEGYTYAARRPVEKAASSRPTRRDLECPPEQGTPNTCPRTQCLGDIKIRFHNAGGLADPEARRRYLRKMMRGIDILGLCETSWESTREADARKVAAWDPQIQADLYVGGQHHRESGSARNAGLALLIRRGAEVAGVRVREHGDPALQCMITDLTIRGEPLRIVLTHGDPSSGERAKVAGYRRIAQAIRKVNAEDGREGVPQRRRAIWMADHNMVKDRDRDEERGTVGSVAAHRRVVAALEAAEASLDDEGCLLDGYTATHAPGARGFTHGVRRIDRAAVSPALLARGRVPRVERVEHIAQDKLEVAVRTAKGWELRTPHHKAVDVTLRFSDEPRAKSHAWVAKARDAYPERVWADAMHALRAEVGRRVRVGLAVGADGEVKVGLQRTTPEERQEGWEVAVRGILEQYEKAGRKRTCQLIGGLRADRERLRRAIGTARAGSAKHKALEACLQRRDRQIQALKIRVGMTEAERERQGLWNLGKDQRATHEVLRGGGIAGSKDVLRIEHPVRGMVSTQEDILDAFEQHMDSTFNLHRQADGERGRHVLGGSTGGPSASAGVAAQAERAATSVGDRAACRRKVVECIRAHREALGEAVVQEAMAGLQVGDMVDAQHLAKAIAQVKKGTVGGSDGFDTSFYAIPCVTEALKDHLHLLYKEVRANGRMPASMRRARLSMLHKGKGRPETKTKNYRPIAVTNTAYRIMMKAVQLKLAPAVTRVVGKTQVAYLTDGRRIWDNTLLLAEIARLMEAEGRGGAAVQVDNTAAFDRVEWDFLQEVMEAMGFPEDFRRFISEIYTDLQFAVRVNGRTGGDKGVSNGVRQGCPASPLIFLIVQEALLIMIREDKDLRGVTVGVSRGRNAEVRERCMADDTVVYLQSAAQATRLFEIIRIFEVASGQRLNPSKSTGILFGQAKYHQDPENTGIRWLRFGEEMVEEGLGIRIGTEEQVESQWREEARAVMEEMRGQMTQCKHTMSTTARVRCIQSAFVSKLTYPWQVQAPECADAIISEVQRKMDAALFEGREGESGWYFVDRGLAMQPPEDGGLGQVDLQCRLEAMWASLVLSLRGRQEVWKGIWERQLESTYGGLRGRDLILSTCGFHLFAQQGEGLEVMRRGVAALAKLPPPEGRVMVPVDKEEAAGGGREEGAGEGGDARAGEAQAWRVGEIGDKTWTTQEVEAQGLFFNPWYKAGTVLTGRSTLHLELEAVKWSEAGLRTWGDLSWGGRLITEEGLRRAHSHLDHSMLRHLTTELHGEWRDALAQGQGSWAHGVPASSADRREVLAMCCWYDVYDHERGGQYLGQYVWELFSTIGQRGLAGRALWHMRRVCARRGEGVELQVHRQNPGARACYERLGGRATAWWVDGIEGGGEASWRRPGQGHTMMRFEASDLDAALDARDGGRAVEGEEVVVADTLEELRHEGLLARLQRAAGIATGGQRWRPRGEIPCLRVGGDGQGCKYVVIVKRPTEVGRAVGEAGCATEERGSAGRGAGGPAGAPEPEARVVVTRARTLEQGDAQVLEHMGVPELYRALVANKWVMPKPFREGGYGSRIWAAKGRAEDSKHKDIARVYAGLRHSAVPLHWSDRAYKAATGTEFAGRVLLGGGARCGACSCDNADTRHRYLACPEVRRLWARVLDAWQRISGGERLDAGDEWVTAWGARWSTWTDERAQKQFGGADLEEVFQVIHKATIQAIHEGAGRRSRRQAQHMYQRVQYLVDRAVADRRRRVPPSTFARVWEAPGFGKRVGRGGHVCTAHMWLRGFQRGGRAPTCSAAGTQAAGERAAHEAHAVGLAARGAMEIYTDGSGQQDGAGWGWVAVRAGAEVKARRGPVVLAAANTGWRGADRATNNTGELTAVLEALEWAVGQGLREVVIRYDSEYAAHMARGEWKAKVSRRLVEQSREALRNAERAGCQVAWRHVKGHSGHVWNERADALASAGVRAPPGGEDVAPGGDAGGGARQVGAQGPRPQFRATGTGSVARVEPRRTPGCGVRWVTYRQTAAERVERATTGFGILNMPVPQHPIAAPAIRAQANKLAARIRKDARAGRVTKGQAERAARRLHDAATRLRQAAEQRREMYASRRPQTVLEVDCDLNVPSLVEYVSKIAVGPSRRVAEQRVQSVMAKARAVGPGRARLRIAYKYSPMGRALVEAGHVTGSRVYAIGVDPFKGWDKGLREAAMRDMGWECDDEAAYVTARIAMVPAGRGITKAFVDHREEILAEVGDALFRTHGDDAARRQWAKRIFAGYDNDATLEGWARDTQGRHEGRTIGRVSLRVGVTASSPGVEFKPSDYWRAQKTSTAWMWDHAGAELREYLTQLRPRATAKVNMGAWKSYVLQEAEAAGRGAKLEWAEAQGIPVLSIQHDGIILGRVGPDDADEGEGAAIREELSRTVSEAVGYQVWVKVTWCAGARRVLQVD